MGIDRRVFGLSCLFMFLAAFSDLGCSRVVESDLPVSWKTEVGPLLTSRCASCHSGQTAPGDYATTSYQDTLGVGSDTASNAIAGDASSRLLTIFEEAAHLAHLGEGEVAEARRALLHRWVMEDELAYFWSAAHPPSIQNPASSEFHGKIAAAEGWTMASCRKCHGGDYLGGAVLASCTTCHQNTPEACNTCHGSTTGAAPPRTVHEGSVAGAHSAHLMVPSGRFSAITCDTCHLVPDRLMATGHIDNADDPAEVTFGGAALADGATPTFEPAAATCTGTYCHGGRSGGTDPAPAWTATGLFTGCDGCHGFPPTTISDGSPHVQLTGCAACHPANVDAAGTIIDVSLHGNGIVEVRANINQCDSCHAGPSAPTPFQDTLGQTDSNLSTVGAHDVHAGPSAFHAEAGDTLGYGCDNCHLVPTGLGDAGHIDGGGAELTFGQVATAKGATPAYDPATGTCTDVYCHGALLDGGGTNPTWAWNAQGTQVVCGGCHSLPPALVTSGGSPFAHPVSTACNTCHASVIDANFVFIDRSLHINGTVDF